MNKNKFKTNSKKEYTIPLRKLCEDYNIDFHEVVNVHCPQKRSLTFVQNTWQDRMYLKITTEEKVLEDDCKDNLPVSRM